MQSIRIERRVARVDLKVLLGESFTLQDLELVSEGEPVDLSDSEGWSMFIRPIYGKNVHVSAENFNYEGGRLTIVLPKELFLGVLWRKASYEVRSIVGGEPIIWFGGDFTLVSE